MPSLPLPRTAQTGWQLVKSTFLSWKQSHTSVLAASLAYFAVFSLAPLLTLVVMIVGLVYGEAAVEGELVSQIEQVVGDEAAQVMETAIASLLTLVFTIVYTVLPDALVHWRDALVGAALTTVLLMGGQLVFWQLLERTEFGSAYGIAGSFVILITWIYFAAHIFFVGAEFTRVYALRLGGAIRPESYAVTTDAQLDGNS